MEEACRIRDINGCLFFVARQNPDFDARVSKRDDSILNAILQAVLDASDSEQLKLLLDLLENFL